MERKSPFFRGRSPLGGRDAEASGGYDSSSVNYGILNDQLLAELSHACPIVASYGAKDRSLRKAPGELEEILTSHDGEHDVKVYPDARHGFLNDHAPGETPRWALLAGKFANTGYHEPSAHDARQRILAVFDAHLAR